MSAGASLGGPVPLPPPGPSAALPPGAPARALHVELPSQQVSRPRAGGAGGREVRSAGLAGLRRADSRRTPRPGPGDQAFPRSDPRSPRGRRRGALRPAGRCRAFPFAPALGNLFSALTPSVAGWPFLLLLWKVFGTSGFPS